MFTEDNLRIYVDTFVDARLSSGDEGAVSTGSERQPSPKQTEVNPGSSSNPEASTLGRKCLGISVDCYRRCSNLQLLRALPHTRAHRSARLAPRRAPPARGLFLAAHERTSQGGRRSPLPAAVKVTSLDVVHRHTTRQPDVAAIGYRGIAAGIPLARRRPLSGGYSARVQIRDCRCGWPLRDLSAQRDRRHDLADS